MESKGSKSSEAKTQAPSSCSSWSFEFSALLVPTLNHANNEPQHGQIDENLNQLKQDDPALIKAVRDRLILPPNKPFKWGSRKHTGW